MKNLLYLEIKQIVANPLFLNTKGSIENVEGFLGLQYPSLGFSFNFDNNFLVSAVFIEASCPPKYAKRLLPFKLEFSDTQADVHIKLGLPNKSSENLTVPILGKMADRDIYYFDDTSLSVTYNSKSASIDRITLMTPESTPGR